MNYNNIPQELKELRQWAVSTGVSQDNDNEGKRPRNPVTGDWASVTDPSTWGTFEEAVNSGFNLIGFMLTKDDPYTIIDLDDPTLNSKKKPEPNSDLVSMRTARHTRILSTFQSYAELSQSGFGKHIIVKGSIPNGCRRDRVEVYSDSRYMICTGNVYNNQTEITDQQELLNVLFKQMQPSTNQLAMPELVEVESKMSDEEVYLMASTAKNSKKFLSLWGGCISGHDNDHSKADYALLEMLCFFTVSNEQVRRLFRQSSLGKRDKAQREDYVNTSIKKLRAAQACNGTVEHGREVMNAILATRDAKRDAELKASLELSNQHAIEAKREQEEKEEAMIAQAEANPADFYPPGFVGDLAKFYFSVAQHPIPEFALVSAIGVCAGIAGRQYNTPSYGGLSLFLAVVAKSGIGKEDVATFIDKTFYDLQTQSANNLSMVPNVQKFAGPGDFKSGPALVRFLSDEKNSKCFVSVLGEFGMLMKEIADDRTGNPRVTLKTELLKMYGKTGFTSTLRASVYSDKEKNIPIIKAPNVTVIGETTPSTLYNNLTTELLSDGFLPRFLIVEYSGPHVRPNYTAEFSLPHNIREHLIRVIETIDSMTRDDRSKIVSQSAKAAQLMEDFSDQCRVKMSELAEPLNEPWNRAHFNALKLASLFAVYNNPDEPCISEADARWAISFVSRSVNHLLSKFENHEVGGGNGRQESDLTKAIKAWLIMDPKTRFSYMNNKTDGPKALSETSLIPYCYLLNKARYLGSFKTDKRDVDVALKAIISTMVQSGKIEQVDVKDTFAKFGMRSAIYRTSETW